MEPKLSVELLTEQTVLTYLIGQGIVGENETATVEILTGGVSNTVIAVSTQKQNIVIKQALPELKVAEKWEADQRRAIVEADALKLFHSLSPDQVPELLFMDPNNFVLGMERVPLGSTVWKDDLLAGIYQPGIATILGRTLGQWHIFGETNRDSRAKFREDTLFEQLRVDPFYRFVAERNQALRAAIQGLIDELENDESSIVHGDFSPKNFMVSPTGNLFILDFEVTHVGNPVFDLAFLLAHLLCKFFRAEATADAKHLSLIAAEFLCEYEQLRALPSSLAKHTALIALARVEGKSPVNYLNSNQQAKLQRFTKSVIMSDVYEPVSDLFEMMAR